MRSQQALTRSRAALPLAASVGVFGFLNLAADYGVVSFWRIYYDNFASIIRAGFSTSVSTTDTVTFPMWGYAYLELLTTSPAALRWIQFALSAGATFFLLGELAAGGHLTVRQRNFAAWLLVVCLPWYAVQLNAYSPNAIGGSLLLLALGCLARHRRETRRTSARTMWAVASGACYGLMLNFRSDYLWALPIVLAFVVAPQGDSVGTRMRIACLWFATTGVLLLPWAWFTATRGGQPMLSSSNSGHVLFIGLGNLPGNRWGIVPRDDDPVMHAEIRQHFGDDRSSVRPETDAYLRRLFFRRLTSSPLEYVRKCLYASAMVVVEGFYPGVFDDSLKARIRARFGAETPGELIVRHWRDLPGMLHPRSWLMVLSEVQGHLYLWLGLAAVAITRVRRAMARSPMLLLLSGLVVYQLAINVLAFHMRIYMNNSLVAITLLGALWLAGTDRAPQPSVGQAGKPLRTAAT